MQRTDDRPMRTRRLVCDPLAVSPSSPFRDFAAGDGQKGRRTSRMTLGRVLSCGATTMQMRETVYGAFAYPGARIRARNSTRADTEG